MTVIQSPCIRVCVLDSRSDSCIGCGRLRSEIAGWRHFSDDQRTAIMTELPERMQRMTSREARGRGGRRAALAAAAVAATPDPEGITVPPDDTQG